MGRPRAFSCPDQAPKIIPTTIMENVSLSLIAAVATVVLVIIIRVTLGRPVRPVCPECSSRKIGREKTFEGMRTVDYHSGGPGGGSTTILMQYTVKNQCSVCGFQWTTKETEAR